MEKHKFINLICLCGHWDSEHVCSDKSHKRKKPKHICNETDRVFCCNVSISDPPWSCECKKVRIDNLKYLEGLAMEKELNA